MVLKKSSTDSQKLLKAISVNILKNDKNISYLCKLSYLINH